MGEVIERIQAAREDVAMADVFDDLLTGDGVGSLYSGF